MTRWRLGLIFLGVFVANAGAAFAQSEPSRFEVGVQASVLRLSDFGTSNTGIGGRFTFNVARWAALEAEGNFYPQDDVLLPGSVANFRVRHFRKRTDGFFGAKLGFRGDRLGLFAKVRPGFTLLSDRPGGGNMCEGEVCALALLLRPEYRTEFALDFGGVLEFYPARQFVARFELGDTVIRHRSSAPPCWGSECTSHNVSSRFGVGLRF